MLVSMKVLWWVKNVMTHLLDAVQFKQLECIEALPADSVSAIYSHMAYNWLDLAVDIDSYTF